MHWYDLTELLPPVFRKIKSMFSAAFAENTELLQFRAYLREIRDNFFIQTCDEQTLQYWESLLNIKLYGGETINERRNMIILHLTNNQAITILYARKVMNDLFGEGNYELFYDQATPYILYITIFDTDLSKLETFLYWFEEVCPAHIQWNAGHTETADTEFEIFAGSQSDYDIVTTASASTGTETLYLGSQATTFNYIEV
jgi:hypothetical protein